MTIGPVRLASAQSLKEDVEDYAQLVVRGELSSEEENNTVLTLIQFPLFSHAESGVITFKHELLAEFLAAKSFFENIEKNAEQVDAGLGSRSDLANTVIGRYVASKLSSDENGVRSVITALKAKTLLSRGFANLLDLLLLAVPAQDIIKREGCLFEGRHGVSFENAGHMSDRDYWAL